MRAAKNFTWDELECHGIDCGHCGVKFINQEAIDSLQKLRDIIGKPLNITSAARCLKHNMYVGGAPYSKHRSFIDDNGVIHESTAFDILLAYSGGVHEQAKLAKYASALGFNGIGYYNSIIHVDHKRYKPAYWDMRS